MDKNKIQRMRNLVSGNYGAKTKTSSGYRKYNHKKQEGDVWEENGKTWTVKNGIRQSISKYRNIKKQIKVPTHCPSCGTHMNHPAHKKIYLIYGHCLHCQTKFETKLMAEGKHTKWLEKEVRKNFDSWTDEKTKQFERWFNSIDTNQYITESGEIEDWSKMSKEIKDEIVSRFNQYLDDEKNKMETIIKESKDEYNN